MKSHSKNIAFKLLSILTLFLFSCNNFNKKKDKNIVTIQTETNKSVTSKQFTFEEIMLTSKKYLSGIGKTTTFDSIEIVNDFDFINLKPIKKIKKNNNNFKIAYLNNKIVKVSFIKNSKLFVEFFVYPLSKNENLMIASFLGHNSYRAILFTFNKNV